MVTYIFTCLPRASSPASLLTWAGRTPAVASCWGQRKGTRDDKLVRTERLCVPTVLSDLGPPWPESSLERVLLPPGSAWPWDVERNDHPGVNEDEVAMRKGS